MLFSAAEEVPEFLLDFFVFLECWTALHGRGPLALHNSTVYLPHPVYMKIYITPRFGFHFELGVVNVAEDHLNCLDEMSVLGDGFKPCFALHQLGGIVQIEPTKRLLPAKHKQRFDAKLAAGESNAGLPKNVGIH